MQQLGIGAVHDGRRAVEEHGAVAQQGIHQARVSAAAHRDAAGAERIGQQAGEHRVDALRPCQNLHHPGDAVRFAVINIAADGRVVLAVHHPAADRAAPRLGSRMGEHPLQARTIPVRPHRIGFGEAGYLFEQQLFARVGIVFIAAAAARKSEWVAARVSRHSIDHRRERLEQHGRCEPFAGECERHARRTQDAQPFQALERQGAAAELLPQVLRNAVGAFADGKLLRAVREGSQQSRAGERIFLGPVDHQRSGDRGADLLAAKAHA